MSVIRKTPEINADIEREISRFNTAKLSDNLEEQSEVIKEVTINLADYEKEYAISARTELFAELAKSPTAMLDAIKTLKYPIIKHKDIADELTKEVVSKELVVRMNAINLLAFDRFVKKSTKKSAAADTSWANIVSKFNQIMCMRAGSELGIDAKKIAKTYYLSKVAADIKMGKTPTSNSAALKLLQQVIDAIIFEDDGKGKNRYKATSHDLTYLDRTYMSKGKEVLQLVTSKDAKMINIITEIIYHIVTGEAYKLGYKRNDND